MKIPTLSRLLGTLLSLCIATTAAAQGTAFTYQGRLTDNSQPANGSYDLQFTLKDAAAAGSTVGTPLALAPVSVSNGLFTVTLDFGTSAFDGSARWLEIGVRTNGSASAHALLSPRQAVTATPYAIQAMNATTATSAATLGGTLAGTLLSGTYGNPVTFNNAANSFSGNGAGLVALGANNISSGTLADQRLSTNVALLNTSPTFSGSVTAGGDLVAARLKIGSGHELTANYSAIAGGMSNQAAADFTLAAGRRAKAVHQGSFVLADAMDADFTSTTTNQFNVRAGGGVRFLTGGAGVTVDGQPIHAASVSGFVSEDTNDVSLAQVFMGGINILGYVGPPTTSGYPYQLLGLPPGTNIITARLPNGRVESTQLVVSANQLVANVNFRFLRIYYQDLDGDGYGNALVVTNKAVSPGPGWAVLPGDPDDGCATCYPGAPEVCDGLDNNGDGQVDEGFNFQTDAHNCGECGRVCPSLICSSGQCVPTCTDLVRDGEETDVDCGGPACGPCANGKMCLMSVDCQSGVCSGGLCQTPTCNDLVKNGTETDVDCGGAMCGKCAAGKQCKAAADCQSGVCTGGYCQ